jgi:uroporphyrinogen-III synthase
MTVSLKGLRVLVTRPLVQAGHLCDLLAQSGADCESLPAMEIVAHADTESRLRLRHAAAWDMLIFVSRNAVEYARPLLERSGLPVVAAIGRKTAEALHQHNIHVEIVPPCYNSESLLAMSVMQRVAAKRILIVRGDGGREKLAETLRRRGARVEYAEVYRRIRPHKNTTRLQGLLAQQQLDVVTIGSGDTLLNLVELAGKQKQALYKLPLIVMSERVGKLAEQLGFADTENIHVAPEASDEGLLAALYHWHGQEDTSE